MWPLLRVGPLFKCAHVFCVQHDLSVHVQFRSVASEGGVRG